MSITRINKFEAKEGRAQELQQHGCGCRRVRLHRAVMPAVVDGKQGAQQRSG